jgi:hypothetical protein
VLDVSESCLTPDTCPCESSTRLGSEKAISGIEGEIRSVHDAMPTSACMNLHDSTKNNSTCSRFWRHFAVFTIPSSAVLMSEASANREDANTFRGSLGLGKHMRNRGSTETADSQTANGRRRMEAPKITVYSWPLAPDRERETG